MSFAVVMIVGLAAGLHAALYGAYKNSPYESFLFWRFLREFLFVGLAAAALSLLRLADGQSLFTIYLSVFALARIATAVWNLILRGERYGNDRTSTRIRWVKSGMDRPFLRLLKGMGFVGSIYGCYRLFLLLPESWPGAAVGLVVGASVGLGDAIAGAYKDSTIEAFSFHMFLKSPVSGAVGGLIACIHTMDPVFMLLAAIGSMRMFNELLFKIIVRGYVPGKFKSVTGPLPGWMSRRRYFLWPYAATWVLYLALVSRLE